VFSPYYARSRRRGTGDPWNHCALNVALYGKAGKRWSLTERSRGSVQPSHAALVIGPSAIAWDGDALTIRIEEMTFPVPSRIRGSVRLHPFALTGYAMALDAAGRHRWSPLAPCARIEAEFTHPALRWSGHGYLDANDGDEPLDEGFHRWHWSRVHVDRRVVILYDVVRRHGGDLGFALSCDRSGGIESVAPPPRAALPRTGWGIARSTRSDGGSGAALLDTFEDTPFYARSLISTRLLGQQVAAMHESLSLDRFRARWVRQLLPFRMPRALR
jgi:carotenoid 1,2-hydratase